MSKPPAPLPAYNLISADVFCACVRLNVDQPGLSDADFRHFVRVSLQRVEYPAPPAELLGASPAILDSRKNR